MGDKMKCHGGIKGAIYNTDTSTGVQWEFYHHDSLNSIVGAALKKFGISGQVTDWALMNDKTGRYVTRENRHEELVPGVMVTIRRSPARLAEDSVNILSNKPDIDICEELRNVVKNAEEYSYAQEFYKLKGVTILLEILTRTPIFDDLNQMILGYSLQAIYLVMEYMGTELWEKILDNMIIKKMVLVVQAKEARQKVLGSTDLSRSNTMSSSTLPRNSSAGLINVNNHQHSLQRVNGGNKEPLMAQYALSLLDSVVRFTESGYDIVTNLLDVSDVIIYITDANLDCAQYALALLNAIFSKTDEQAVFYHGLLEYNIRVKIEKVIRVVKSSPINDNMNLSHHICEFQNLLLKLHQHPASVPVNAEDPNHLCMLERIKIEALAQQFSSEWSGLGFSDTTDRTRDFQMCPPGLLALQCINHFVQKHYDRHREMILDQLSRDKERQCPFVMSAVAVTGMLYDQLKIGKDYIGVEIDFQPVIFSQDNIFFELFSISVQLFNTTWHEMHAKLSDFNKVVDVVREQLTLVFKGDKKINNTEDFKSALNNYPFSKIQEQRLKSLEKDSQPIIQLREKLKPELQKLVNQQRLAILEAGEEFRVPSSARRGPKTMFCRLSSNHKVLHYGYDCTPSKGSTCRPIIEDLDEKLNVSDLEGIILWKDIRKQKRTWQDSPLGFSLEYNQSLAMDAAPKTLHFIAPTEDVFSYWTDGINVLRKKDALNEQAQKHLSMLLEMELKIRQLDILDIEGLHLPDQTPSIPKLPDNYKFHYNFN